MIRRAIAAIAVIWFMGFLWFTVSLPGPMDSGATQAVIVPTGAAGRIERGLEVVEGGDAGLMLVTGVDREVRPSEFAVQFEVPKQLMQCCVFLGFDAVDTRGNATETAEWIAERDIRSIRLVTTDWHMRRAALELSRAIPENVVIVEDAVVSEPSLRILFLEYHKYLASKVSGLWG